MRGTAMEIVTEHNRRTEYVLDWLKSNGYDEWLDAGDQPRVIDMCLSLWGVALGERKASTSTRALLSGDLADAVGYCDDVNVKYLRLYWRWIYNNLPGDAVYRFRRELGQRIVKRFGS